MENKDIIAEIELVEIEENWKNIGDKLYRLKFYDEAMTYYMKCLDIQRQILPGVNEKTAKLLHKIGIIHHRLKNLDKAEEYLNESLGKWTQITPSLETDAQLALVLYNKGLNYFYKERYEDALRFYNESLKLNRTKWPCNKNAIGTILYSMGASYKRLCKYDEALDYYKQSLVMRTIDHMDLAKSLCAIGETYFYLGKKQEALDYFKESLNERIQIDSRKNPTIEDLRGYIVSVDKEIGREKIEKFIIALMKEIKD